MKISIGNDHAGTFYKFRIIEYLNKRKYIIKNPIVFIMRQGNHFFKKILNLKLHKYNNDKQKPGKKIIDW